MGLAVSQVRLLALTRRKADIELDIQVDSKRKQALTRKSTELSQTYYQKLQQMKIQYATSDGYENVNYDYIMGKSSTGYYDHDFLKQVMFMNGNIDQKTCNSMILTNKHGEVVLNDELSSLVTATLAGYGDKDTEVQTAEAIKEFISQNEPVDANQDGDIAGYGQLAKVLEKIDKAYPVAATDPSMSTQIITKMLKNGGYMEGGTIYLVDGSTDSYVNSAELARNASMRSDRDCIRLQDGYNYTVLNSDGSIADTSTYTCMYDSASKSFIKNTAKAEMQYLSNIVAYFGPMISSALKNGITSSVSITGVENPRGGSLANANPAGPIELIPGQNPDDYVAAMGLTAGQYVVIKDTDGTLAVFENTGSGPKRVTDLSRIKTNVDEHAEYTNARDTDILQSGFQSGMYQLCMVDSMAKGRYHKNTTLDFFIHMSYVAEKLDSSAREEITAWYNSEQAKISEQETYWDEEITNLSTELNSVNTEIDSVKTLKSNAIKSVFDWGSN